jgi:transposase-like protein
MGRSTNKETGLSEQRKYRSWTAQQKLEIVLAGMRGDRSVRDVCREHGIAETLYYGWRDKILEAGREALAGKEERSGERELRRKIGELERALGRKTYELEIAGKAAHGRAGHPDGCKWDAGGIAVRSSAMQRLSTGCEKHDAGVPRHLDLCHEHADQTL